jgi:hypothetical protein
MKTETQVVVFALIIVLSVSVAAAAVTNSLTANGQVFNPYGTTSTTTLSPTTPDFVAGLSASGLQVHAITGLLDMSVPGYRVYGADGVYVIQNLKDGVWDVEMVFKDNLNVPITVTPEMGLYGADIFRTGTSPITHTSVTMMGASSGCPASSSSVNPGSWVSPVLPSAADGTHDSSGVTMSFQVSTLNISNSSKPKNNEPIVATSVRDEFLALHPNMANASPAANQVQLQQSLCTVTTKIGNVSFSPTTIQPGQTATIESNVNSTDWGFSCAPVANALVNYNVQAGSSTYQALKTSEMIVFSPQESNICGS